MKVREYVELLDESNIDVYVNEIECYEHIASAGLGGLPSTNIRYCEVLDREIEYISHKVSKVTGGVDVILHLINQY